MGEGAIARYFEESKCSGEWRVSDLKSRERKARGSDPGNSSNVDPCGSEPTTRSSDVRKDLKGCQLAQRRMSDYDCNTKT